MHWNKAFASWTEGPREYITYKMETPAGHSSYATEAMEIDETKEYLVGEPYTVVESDPGSFVLVARECHSHTPFRRIHTDHTAAGVLGVEVKEVVSIDPDGIEHMRCGRDS